MIGIVAGFVVVYAVEFLDKRLKIDDPCGAISVHGFCRRVGSALRRAVRRRHVPRQGRWDGTACFQGVKGVIPAILDGDKLFATNGAMSQLGAQVIDIGVGFIWAFGITYLIFMIAKRFMKIRVPAEVEIEGTDEGEFGQVCYPDFVLRAETHSGVTTELDAGKTPSGAGDRVPTRLTGEIVKLVVAVIKPFKLDEVTAALRALEISGVTLSEVRGYGRQRGHTEVYRGAEYEVDFVPKVKLEVLLEDSDAEKVASADHRRRLEPARSEMERSGSCRRVRRADPDRGSWFGRALTPGWRHCSATRRRGAVPSVAQYAALIDEWLRRAAPRPGRRRPRCRRRLRPPGAVPRQRPRHPACCTTAADDVAALADRLWYPLWDAGLQVDHSVRTVREAVTEADRDLKVAVGLLDARRRARRHRLGAHPDREVRADWRSHARTPTPRPR